MQSFFLSWKLHDLFQKLIYKQNVIETVFNYNIHRSSVADQKIVCSIILMGAILYII